MTLLDGQYQYGGLTIGAGTVYGIRSIEGLEDLNVRSGDRELPRGHGSVPGPHFAAAKDIVFQLVVRSGGSAATLAERLADLRAAFAVDEEGDGLPSAMTLKRPGFVERRINVAPIAVVHAESFETVDRVAFPSVALTAADPRIYSSAEHSVPLVPHDPQGGRLDFPVDYPKDFPAGVSTEVVATNAGKANAYPLVRFFGPTDAGDLTGVTLRNMTTGQALTVTTDIGSGQILTVDNLAHVTGSGEQVVGLDGASRYGSWQQPRVPFVLPPGDSLLRYEIAGTTLATNCSVTWRDTWL